MRLLARPHKFDGSFLIPKSIAALASCTTSVYVNLSKNSFFLPAPHFCAKASAKVQQISIPSKLLGENFSKKSRKFSGFMTIQNSTLYIIIGTIRTILRFPHQDSLKTRRQASTDHILQADRKWHFHYIPTAHLYRPVAYKERI